MLVSSILAKNRFLDRRRFFAFILGSFYYNKYKTANQERAGVHMCIGWYLILYISGSQSTAYQALFSKNTKHFVV